VTYDGCGWMAWSRLHLTGFDQRERQQKQTRATLAEPANRPTTKNTSGLCLEHTILASHAKRRTVCIATTTIKSTKE
jgi:hypothetical protein